MTVRVAKSTDAEALLDLFAKLDRETDFMLMEPGERKTTAEEQRSIVETFEKDEHRTMLVAETDRLVGFCVLVGGQQARNAHVASLVMGVEELVWGKGIGSELISYAIHTADKFRFSRIELTVHKENHAAVRLYKKFNFNIEGERISSIKLNGNLINEYYMARV